jgi:hypothetical protein
MPERSRRQGRPQAARKGYGPARTAAHWTYQLTTTQNAQVCTGVLEADIETVPAPKAGPGAGWWR